MSNTKPITLPVALDWVAGEIARLEQLRDERYAVAVQVNAEIEHIDDLLDELATLRGRC